MDLIQRRFKCLALCIHPDKRGYTEKIKQLNQIECELMDNGAQNIYETYGWKFALGFLKNNE